MSKSSEKLRFPGKAELSSSRNLGFNYSLAWNTGNNTHLTLLYFNNCKRGYEQNRVKQLAEDYMLKNLDTNITLELGDMYSDRCVTVKNKKISYIQLELAKYFTSLKFEMSDVKQPHICTNQRRWFNNVL